MNKPVKLPEIRKEVFLKARESQGLSTKELSGKACLSVRQIEQIENGEMSSFYGPQVKVTAAKKVAGLLKIKEEDAFDFGASPAPFAAMPLDEAVSSKSKSSPANQNAQTENISIAEPVTKSATKSATKLATESVAAANSEYAAHSPNSGSKKKPFLLLAIAAAIIFAVVNLRPLFFPEPVKQEVVIIQEAVPEPPPANVPAEPPVADNKAAVSAVAVAEAAPAAVSIECPSADAAPLNYKPEVAKKSGDMVYVQSKTTQTICMTDGAGKTQNRVLEAGIGASFFGKPPLKVMTGGLNQVDMYFQGAKVRIGNTSNKTIILEPAEIVQPVAPAIAVDSQPRQ